MRKRISVFDVSPFVLLIKVVLDEDECGVFVELYLHGKTQYSEKTPVPVPFCPLQVSRGLARYRKRASAVRGRRLTEP